MQAQDHARARSFVHNHAMANCRLHGTLKLLVVSVSRSSDHKSSSQSPGAPAACVLQTQVGAFSLPLLDVPHDHAPTT
eukprot:scaffold305001_cov18-Tisochrysis_lutea.AAC.1